MRHRKVLEVNHQWVNVKISMYIIECEIACAATLHLCV